VIRWRLRTMLVLVAFSALIVWGVYLKRRGDVFQGLALRETGNRMKLSMLAFQAERKIVGHKEYEQTLARGKIVTVFTSDDAQERESNRAFLVESETWWSERAAEYHAQAADHQQMEDRFQRLASRPWESVPPEWKSQEADRFRRIALEHAELEVMCRTQVDRCKAESLRCTNLSKKAPAAGDRDRREEFARQAESFARKLREALIQAEWHTAMRRKYRQAASHPEAPVLPNPPNPNLL
jgi:hypothetical protein